MYDPGNENNFIIKEELQLKNQKLSLIFFLLLPITISAQSLVPLDFLLGFEIKGPVKEINHYTRRVKDNSNGFDMDEKIIQKMEILIDEKNRLLLKKTPNPLGGFFIENYFWDSDKIVRVEIESTGSFKFEVLRIYSYDKDTFTISKRYYNNSAEDTSTTYYYDGRILSFYNNSKKRPRRIYYYNEQKLLIKDEDYSGGKLYSETNYKYNQEGLVIEAIVERNEGSDKDDTSLIKYYYNPITKLLVKVESISSKDGLKNRTTYKYDVNGNLVNEYLDFLEEDRFSDESYEYSDNGQLKSYTIINPCGQSNDKYILEYDSYGNWIKKYNYYLFAWSPESKNDFTPTSIEYREITYYE